MSRVARRRTKGFWRGLVTGLLLAAAAAIGLTIAYPPMVFTRPEMTPGNELAPSAPQQPDGGTVPDLEAADSDWLLIPRADAPLITVRPEAETPPGLEGMAPVPAPSVFDGGNTGSPSLVAPTGH